mgnify:FL=1|jgi:hypothetical protein
MQKAKEENIMSILVGVIGLCAVALLIYYVYVLMKGDKQ